MSEVYSNPLLGIALFQGMSIKDRAALASKAIDKTYETGEIIFEEGDEGQAFYVILSGEVKITKKMKIQNEEEYEQVEIGKRVKGDIVGEMALLDHKPRSARMTATTPTRVLIFHSRLFDLLMTHYPSFFREILLVLTQRLRELSEWQVRQLEMKNHELEVLNKLQEKRISILQQEILKLRQALEKR